MAQYIKHGLRLSTLAAAVALAGCGGSSDNPQQTQPRKSEQKATIAPTATIVEAADTQKITESTVDKTTGLTQVTISTNSEIAKTPVGQVVVIEGGRDSRYPLGLSGRVTKSELVDGQQIVTLAPVTLAEAFDKIDIESKTQINDKTILRTITPRMEDIAVQPTARSVRAAAKSSGSGELALFSKKYPNKGSLAGTVDAVQVKSIGAGLELNIERPFYDFDGNPATDDDQILIKASFKMENAEQVNQIYFDKTDFFQPLKSLDFQSSAKISGGVKLTGKIEGDLNVLAGAYSRVWEQFEKIATDETGTLSLTGLSEDDKKGTIPLACWAVGAEPFAVVNPQQFQQRLTIGGAFVCVSLKMTMGATGQIEAGLELSNQKLRYGITGKADKNGVINANFINELKPDASALQNQQAEIKLPYIKFDGQLNHDLGFDASADAIIAGIRPLSIGAMAGYSMGVKVRGEMGFKGESLTGLSRYADACISDAQIGYGLKVRALAALGLQAKISILGSQNELSASSGASWYSPKPDNLSQGWQGAWYNTFDRTSICSGKAQIEIPFLVAVQKPSTSAGYPVQLTWPEVKAEDFGIGSNEAFLTDKKSWKMIIDGQEYPFEPNKDKPSFIHVFNTTGKHTATLEITGQLGGAASKTIDVMVKGAAVTATPEKTTVGGTVKLIIAQATDVILNVGQKLATVVWSVIDSLGQTITTATTAIGDAFEHAFSLRGDYTVNAQLKDEKGQSVGTVLTQKVTVEACVQNCPNMVIVSATPSTLPLGQPVTIQVIAENAPNTAVFALEGAVCSAPVLGTSAQGFTTITEVCTPSAVGSTKLTIKPKSGAQTGVTTLTVNVVDAKKVEGKFVVPANSTGVAFIPPVDNEPVVGTLGQVLEYGASRRNMTCSFKATGTTKTYKSYDLVDANGYATTVLPLHNGLPNMALVANDALIGVEKTGVAVKAGERLSFKLNDNEPADNEGALTVAYSCEESAGDDVAEYPTRWYQALMQEQQQNKNLVYTVNSDGDMVCATYDGINCLWGSTFAQIDFKKVYPLVCGSEHMKKQYGTDGYSDPKHWCSITKQRHAQKLDSVLSALSGRFDVPAAAEKGIAFTSPSSTKPLACSFGATGLTAENGQQPFASPDGMSGYYVAAATMPTAQILELIAKRGNGVYERIGKNKTLQLKANEKFAFVVNDAGYAGNSGQYDVTYTCSEISQPTWITNPANGHQYAAIDCGTWTQCEAQAVALGGHLVSINDAAEQAWVAQNIVSKSSNPQGMWIGLSDSEQEGVWKWSNGDLFSYSNWSSRQPDNARGVEDFVHMNGETSQYVWNDFPNNPSEVYGGARISFGVVERIQR